MGNCKCAKKRSDSFDDMDDTDYYYNKFKNKKKGKSNQKKNKKSYSKKELNEREIKFDTLEKNQDPNEKKEYKSPERDIIKDYESTRPSLKIVTRKTNNNSTILIGLANIGATCYMNATLQCLSNTDKLTNYFLKEFKYDKSDDTKKISNQYYKLIHHLWDKYTDKKDYAPNSFKKVLSEANPLFSGINSNDSKDLLNFLLETLHRELNNVPKEKEDDNNIIDNNINQLNEEYIKQNFFKDFAKKYRSIISDLFYFTYEIKTQCCGCQFIKYNFQVNSFLEFPLEQVNKYLYNNGKITSLKNIDGSNKDINLYDCFEYNQKIDLKNQMYCSLCNNCHDSYYSTTLFLLPEILVINLNRGKNAVYQCNVNFPEELDLTNYVINKIFNTQYELYAVICHYGRPNSMSGHFVAYCRNRMDNQWYLYNDSIVTLCEKPKENLNKMPYIPYILFYRSKINNNNIQNNININNNINIVSNNNNLNIFNNYNILNQTINFNNNLEFESNEDENINCRSKSFAYPNINERIGQIQDENEDENIISVIFGTTDQKLHYSVPCRKTDSFSRIEKKLYKEYPEYKEKNKYFLVNGNQIDVNKTIEENKIKNSDVIFLNIVDDIQ